MTKIDNIPLKYKDNYNKLADHPLQSCEWGEFREKTGVKVVRRGIFENKNLIGGFQLTIHKIPRTSLTIGYLPKGNLPTEEILRELTKIGEKHNCIFIKLEPNTVKQKAPFKSKKYKLIKSPHPLFTKFTFHIDLTKSEDELLAQMKSKTRYNLRLAEKKGVKVIEDNSRKAFEQYLNLMEKTTKRQKYFAHNKDYHRKMWEFLHKAGIAHLLKAVYKGEILVCWIVFLFNNILYYPYGASSDKYRNLMASNLIMFEAMRWGKANGAKLFDMWGALGPDPDKADPWYGFHRFKQGYGGKLVEFTGSYDLILKPLHYRLYNLVHILRWLILRRREF